MKKIIKIPTQILFVISLIWLVLFIDPCNGSGSDPIILTDTVWEYDTTWVYGTIDNTKYPDPEIIYVKVPVNTPIDTPAVIQDYNNKKYYERTLVNDSNLTFILEDTLQFNKIIHSNFYYKINRPLQVITNTTLYKDTYRFSIGGFTNVMPFEDTFTVDFGPSMTFQKNKMLYGFQYGVVHKSVGGKMEYILFRR